MLVNMYLFWGAWQDIRKRRITDNYLILGGFLGFLILGIRLLLHQRIWWEWLCALLPGSLMLFGAKAAKEKIGDGDGWVLWVLGNVLSARELCGILGLAVFFLMIFSVLLLCSRMADRDLQIPFLPFLWLAHMILWGKGYV